MEASLQITVTWFFCIKSPLDHHWTHNPWFMLVSSASPTSPRLGEAPRRNQHEDLTEERSGAGVIPIHTHSPGWRWHYQLFLWTSLPLPIRNMALMLLRRMRNEESLSPRTMHSRLNSEVANGLIQSKWYQRRDKKLREHLKYCLKLLDGQEVQIIALACWSLSSHH